MNGVLQFILRLVGAGEAAQGLDQGKKAANGAGEAAKNLGKNFQGFAMAGTAATAALASMGPALQGNTTAMLTLAMACGQFWRAVSMLNPVLRGVMIAGAALMAVWPKISEAFQSAETRAEKARAELEKLCLALSRVEAIRLDTRNKIEALKALADAGKMTRDAMRELTQALGEVEAAKVQGAMAEIERKRAELEGRMDLSPEAKAQQAAELGFAANQTAAEGAKAGVDREVAAAQAAREEKRTALEEARATQARKEKEYQAQAVSFQARIRKAETPEEALKLLGEQRSVLDPMFSEIQAGRTNIAGLAQSSDTAFHTASALERAAGARKKAIESQQAAADARTRNELNAAMRAGRAGIEEDIVAGFERDVAGLDAADRARREQREQRLARQAEALDAEGEAAAAKRAFEWGGMTPEERQRELARQAAELAPLKENPAFAGQYWDTMGKLRGEMEKKQTYGLQGSSLQEVFKAAYGFGEDPAQRTAVTLERIEQLVKDLGKGGVPQ